MSKHNVTALVPRSDAIFKNICDMEEETSAINNLVNALAMICVSDDIDEPLGSTLQFSHSKLGITSPGHRGAPV